MSYYRNFFRPAPSDYFVHKCLSFSGLKHPFKTKLKVYPYHKQLFQGGSISGIDKYISKYHSTKFYAFITK